jgi:lipopolysaccharide export system protein LptA
MQKKIFILLTLIALIPSLNSRAQEYMTITGETFAGSTENGEMIRTVTGNVVLRQGDIVITCNKTIQHLSKNSAQLIGNVVARQRNVTIYTSEGFYFGNERKAISNTGIKLDDKKVILTAENGEYFFKKDEAFFHRNVKLYDTATTLTSNDLTYFKTENKVIAIGNVKIIDSENLIEADTVIHLRTPKITYAMSNVKITNFANHSVVYGAKSENYNLQKYSLVTGNARLIQIDTAKAETKGGAETIDTLLMRSQKMEAFQDTANIFIATDSVRIVRGSFASKNDYTFYNRGQEKIITKKMSKTSAVPIIWYDNSQMTGDSITIILDSNRIKMMTVNVNAFILSQNIIYKNRFDQISGSKVNLYFFDNELKKTDVFGGVYSIYYTYDSDAPNGLTKSSSQTSTILFLEKRVDQVKLYGSPVSEYYPEKLVKGKELSYTLPGYVFYTDRPTKKTILGNLNKHSFK